MNISQIRLAKKKSYVLLFRLFSWNHQWTQGTLLKRKFDIYNVTNRSKLKYWEIFYVNHNTCRQCGKEKELDKNVSMFM